MLACGRHSLATGRRASAASRPALSRAAASAKAGGGSAAAAAAGPKLLWLSTSNQVLLELCLAGWQHCHTGPWTAFAPSWPAPGCTPIRRRRLHSGAASHLLPLLQDALTAGLEAGVSTVVFAEGQAALAREWQQLGRFEALTRAADGRLLGADGMQVGGRAGALSR